MPFSVQEVKISINSKSSVRNCLRHPRTVALVERHETAHHADVMTAHTTFITQAGRLRNNSADGPERRAPTRL